MKLLRSLTELPTELQGGAVAIGNFDGVHRGHAFLAARLVEHARECGGPAIVFTFDPHPGKLLWPDRFLPTLTWTERKAELLGELGVDAVLAYPTDRELLSLSAEDFFRRIVVERLQSRAMVEGPDFCFGKNRSGDTALLTRLCGEASVALEIVTPICDGEQCVSSSRVRAAIQAGDLDAARRMLTQPYRIRGQVAHGAGRGADLGCPTANVTAVETLLPAPGVFAGRAITSQAGAWPAAIHIGPNPTFAEAELKFEVHLVGFAGTLYGQPLQVDFFSKLRDIHTFASVEALQQQLTGDVRRALEIYREIEQGSCRS